MIVMKFGGASLADENRIRHACEIVRAHRRKRPVIVLSALRGVTDELIRLARAAARGHASLAARGLAALEARHRRVAARLFGEPAGALPGRARAEGRRETVLADVSRLGGETEDLYRGISLLGELSPRSLDLVCSVGERLSARIFAAALASAGVPAAYVDARVFLVTDSDHGRAQVDFGATNRRLRRLLPPLLKRGKVPVVTGFIGATPEGATTTLGRGGSDYSASIVAAGLGAREVWFWKEVDGVCTADPSLCADARVVPHISYQEAAELSHFGAAVLHPRTMLPAMHRSIPIRVRNTLRPAFPGTVITARGSRAPNPLIVSHVDRLSLVTVQGAGLVGSPALVARVLSEVGALGVNVYMVSMASSEYNVSLAIPAAETGRTVARLKAALRVDHRWDQEVENVLVEPDVAVIAAVGSRMKGQVGIAGKVFSALGGHGVNILAIAQGSSEYNISMAVARRDLKRAVQAIHAELVTRARPGRVGSARLRPGGSRSESGRERALRAAGRKVA
jgi:aspartate kinase